MLAFVSLVVLVGCNSGNDSSINIVLRLIVAVPKDVLDLTLYVGTYPPKKFKADSKIHKEIQDWKD